MAEPHWTYQREYVKCGKPGCRSCPHGPYWYAYRKEKGRTKKKYVGKEYPSDELKCPPLGSKEFYLDGIFSKETASLELAREILGSKRGDDIKAVKKRFRELSILHHPDRGGDSHVYRRISCAWSYYQSVYRG